MGLHASYPFLTGLNNAPGNFQADANFVWDAGSLSWVVMTQPGGGGGGAVTIADGADVTLGAIADAGVVGDVAGTVSAKLRGINRILNDVWSDANNDLRVEATQSGAWSTGRTWTLASGTDSVTVTGTVTANQGGAWTVAATQSGAWSTGRTWVLDSATDDVTVTGTVAVSGTVSVAGTISTKTDLAPTSPAAVSVGLASTAIAASNVNRRGITITNTSTARISLAFGVAAVLDSGITLYPGDSFIMDEYSFDTGAINGIASAAASNLGVQEFNA